VVIVGGNISAADLVADLSPIVSGPLYLSQRGHSEALDSVFGLDGVVIKPPVERVSAINGGTIEFEDGSTVENFDKFFFATGYWLSIRCGIYIFWPPFKVGNLFPFYHLYQYHIIISIFSFENRFSSNCK